MSAEDQEKFDFRLEGLDTSAFEPEAEMQSFEMAQQLLT